MTSTIKQFLKLIFFVLISSSSCLAQKSISYQNSILVNTINFIKQIDSTNDNSSKRNKYYCYNFSYKKILDTILIK